MLCYLNLNRCISRSVNSRLFESVDEVTYGVSG